MDLLAAETKDQTRKIHVATVLLRRNLTGNVLVYRYRMDTKPLQELEQNRYRMDTKRKWKQYGMVTDNKIKRKISLEHILKENRFFRMHAS